MAIKQIRDYQRKYDIDLIGTEVFIIQEQSGSTSGITKSTTLFDVMNKNIEYMYSIEGPDKPYPKKETLSLNESILIKDSINTPSGNNTTTNHVKYTDLNNIRMCFNKFKEFIHYENVIIDFSKESHYRIRIQNGDITQQIPPGFVNISFINCSLTSVQEIIIECINFHGKQVNWLQPGIKWQADLSYTPIKSRIDSQGQIVVDTPSIDLIKIISIEGREFYGFILAHNLE